MDVETKTVAILATLDTKGQEAKFLSESIAAHGLRPLTIDISTTDASVRPAGIGRSNLLQGVSEELAEAINSRDRGTAVAAMGEAAAQALAALHDAGKIDGVIGIGGSGGTSMACRAMRALPLGRAEGNGLDRRVRRCFGLCRRQRYRDDPRDRRLWRV